MIQIQFRVKVHIKQQLLTKNWRWILLRLQLRRLRRP